MSEEFAMPRQRAPDLGRRVIEPGPRYSLTVNV